VVFGAYDSYPFNKPVFSGALQQNPCLLPRSNAPLSSLAELYSLAYSRFERRSTCAKVHSPGKIIRLINWLTNNILDSDENGTFLFRRNTTGLFYVGVDLSL